MVFYLTCHLIRNPDRLDATLSTKDDVLYYCYYFPYLFQKYQIEAATSPYPSVSLLLYAVYSPEKVCTQ